MDQIEDAIRDIIEGLVAEQIRPWQGRGLTHYTVAPRLRALAGRQPTVVLFVIEGGHVSPVETSGRDLGGFPADAWQMRHALYTRLLGEAVALHPPDGRILVAIDLGDGAPDSPDLPVFSFQKHAGAANPLLPDLDLIALDYLESAPRDPCPFGDKACRATFAGSTTGGGLITPETVRAGAFPRLRAARFFRSHAAVDFRLTQIVQCASPEAEALLRAEGFGSGRFGWPEAFGAKFGLSLDGNGAACSRPAILLASHCALVKYRSPHGLYYFPALRPGEHFLEVDGDDAVLAILDAEAAAPGRYAAVAENGRRLAERLLTRAPVLAYTAALLRAYEAALAR